MHHRRQNALWRTDYLNIGASALDHGRPWHRSDSDTYPGYRRTPALYESSRSIRPFLPILLTLCAYKLFHFLLADCK